MKIWLIAVACLVALGCGSSPAAEWSPPPSLEARVQKLEAGIKDLKVRVETVEDWMGRQGRKYK